MQLTVLPTLVSLDRLANIIKYSHYASQLKGAACEFGVYRGGSLELIAKLNEGNDVFGIDSFQGLPKESEHDFHREGDFNDVDSHSLSGYFKIMHPHVKILKGFSPKVFKYFEPSIYFRFVHIDVDLYNSVYDALEFFYDRVCTGGVILIDDYKVHSTPGCEKAINDYMDSIGRARHPSHRQELKYFDTNSSDSHKQYLIIK